MCLSQSIIMITISLSAYHGIFFPLHWRTQRLFSYPLLAVKNWTNCHSAARHQHSAHGFTTSGFDIQWHPLLCVSHLILSVHAYDLSAQRSFNHIDSTPNTHAPYRKLFLHSWILKDVAYKPHLYPIGEFCLQDSLGWTSGAVWLIHPLASICICCHGSAEKQDHGTYAYRLILSNFFAVHPSTDQYKTVSGT